MDDVNIDSRLWRDLFENLYRIRDKMCEEFLSASEAMRILDVTRRQLFYWHVKAKLPTKREESSHSRKAFSILDLLAFTVFKKLRGHEIGLDMAEPIFKSLHRFFRESNSNIHQFAIGKPMTLFIDMHKKTLVLSAGDGINLSLDQLLDSAGAFFVMRIDPLLRTILERTKREDFYAEFAEGEAGALYKVIFYVDGEAIEFKELKQCMSNSTSHDGTKNSGSAEEKGR